jgi:hypothetical protein
MRVDTAIAGASFRKDGLEIIAGLKPGQRYVLEREPSNPYDPKAVKVLIEGYTYGLRKPGTYHIGYIPRKWSGTVSAALENDQLYVWATKRDSHWGTITISWVDITADPL